MFADDSNGMKQLYEVYARRAQGFEDAFQR